MPFHAQEASEFCAAQRYCLAADSIAKLGTGAFGTGCKRCCGPLGDFLISSGSRMPLESDESEPELEPELVRVSLPAHMQFEDRWIWLVEFDLGMRVTGKAQVAQLEPLEFADELDEADESEDTDAPQSFVFIVGSTISIVVLLGPCDELCAAAFTNGESSMNASVFLSSSNVNEQLASLGVVGALSDKALRVSE